MSDRLTVTLHELVAELDIFADRWLRERYGVSYNLFELLATLAEVAPVDITGLARCLRVTKAAVSKRVPALVAEGWITTQGGGGRRIELGLAPRGAELVRTAGGELEAEFTAMIADPRLGTDAPAPGGAPAIDPALLNRHLVLLTDIVISKGLPS